MKALKCAVVLFQTLFRMKDILVTSISTNAQANLEQVRQSPNASSFLKNSGCWLKDQIYRLLILIYLRWHSVFTRQELLFMRSLIKKQLRLVSKEYTNTLAKFFAQSVASHITLVIPIEQRPSLFTKSKVILIAQIQ